MIKRQQEKESAFRMHCTIWRPPSGKVELTVYPDPQNMETRIVHEYPNQEAMDKYIGKALCERNIDALYPK